MSALTDYAENRLIDALLRGQLLNAPSTLYIALSTEPRDEGDTPVEPEGGGYARVALTADLDNFTGTQGTAGAVSSGYSGVSSNAATIDFPESTDAWGQIRSVWIMDDSSAGNAWLSADLVHPITVSGPYFNLSFASGKLKFEIARNALTDYAANRIIDALLRGQPLDAPNPLYFALSILPRSRTDDPTEPEPLTAYERVAVDPSVLTFTATQGGAGSISAGTDGETENAAPITFPDSEDAWGEIQSVALMDDETAGKPWISVNLENPVDVSGPDFALSFEPGQIHFRIDD